MFEPSDQVMNFAVHLFACKNKVINQICTGESISLNFIKEYEMHHC